MCIYMCKHSFLFHLASEPWRMFAGHICTIQRIRSLIQKKKKKREVLSHHGSSRQGWRERGEQRALEILGDASITCLLSNCSFQPAGAVSVLCHGHYQSWRLYCCSSWSSSTSSPPCRKPMGSLRGQWVTPPWAHGCRVLQWRCCNPASVFVLTVSLGGMSDERGLAFSTADSSLCSFVFWKRPLFSRRWCWHTRQFYETGNQFPIALQNQLSHCGLCTAITLPCWPLNHICFPWRALSWEVTATPCVHTEGPGILGGNIKAISIFL